MNYSNQRLSIRLWAEGDRPREKLIQKGRLALSDAELLAILLGSGNSKESAVELARKILDSVGNDLNSLAKLGLNELCDFKGIGKAKALTVIASLELARRRKNTGLNERVQLLKSEDVFKLMSGIFLDLPYEEFWVLYLNKANRLLCKQCISRGGISGTVADPKIIFKIAVEQLASSLILLHNHPSGNLKPSQPDIDLTGKLREAAIFFDMQVLDHIIFTDYKYFSMADNGML